MLLRTNSQAVIIEAAAFFFHCSPCFERQYEISQVARSTGHAVAVSLVRILASSYTINQAPILQAILVISRSYPQYFIPHYKEFFLRFEESTC